MRLPFLRAILALRFVNCLLASSSVIWHSEHLEICFSLLSLSLGQGMSGVIGCVAWNNVNFAEVWDRPYLGDADLCVARNVKNLCHLLNSNMHERKSYVPLWCCKLVSVFLQSDCYKLMFLLSAYRCGRQFFWCAITIFMFHIFTAIISVFYVRGWLQRWRCWMWTPFNTILQRLESVTSRLEFDTGVRAPIAASSTTGTSDPAIALASDAFLPTVPHGSARGNHGGERERGDRGNRPFCGVDEVVSGVVCGLGRLQKKKNEGWRLGENSCSNHGSRQEGHQRLRQPERFLPQSKGRCCSHQHRHSRDGKFSTFACEECVGGDGSPRFQSDEEAPPSPGFQKAPPSDESAKPSGGGGVWPTWWRRLTLAT